MKPQEPTELVKLKNVLKQENPNYSVILELATRLASQDPHNVRFTTDAELVSRLGKELVARQETAVSELVKNAYDADATVVRVIFSRTEKAGGELFVVDNGSGMSRKELIDGFMRLASGSKIEEPVSTRYGRRRAGRKGIGRFAAQRLGSQLELTTQKLNRKNALRVSLRWDKFKRNRDLSSIASPIRENPKKEDEGTTLHIKGLREAWTDARIARAYRFTDELIQPFPLSKRTMLPGELDPGFKATFYKRIRGKDIEVASEDRMVFDHALAEVTATVNARGKGHWHLVSKRYDLDEKTPFSPDKESPNLTFKHLRNVHLHAYYFIWHSALVPRQQSTQLRSLANEQGGIRLYRNGFRVLPYGEPRNDWLGLDERYRQRSALFPLGNTNWFGFVEITDAEGTKFEETSSREGIANNPSYDELVSFASQALVAAAQRVASVRGRKLTAGQKDYRAADTRPSEETLTRIADDLEAIAKRLRKVSDQKAIRSAAEKVLNAGKALLEENSTLRVLSSLGLTIAIFAHEVRHRIFNLQQLTGQKSDAGMTPDEQKKLLLEVESGLKVLQAYTAYFDKTISQNVRREIEEQDLTDLLFTFIDEFRAVVERRGVKFVDEIEEGLLTIRMHSSEWASVLANLLTNSLKAIRRGRHRGDGHILVRAWQKDGTIFLEFADDGDGIPNEIQMRIFDPFFTTTGVSDVSDSELAGMGLGLTIVRDILSAYGGSIRLSKAPKDYSTCFRIEISAADETPEP